MTNSFQGFLDYFNSLKGLTCFPEGLEEDLLIFADLCHDLGEYDLEIGVRYLAEEKKYPFGADTGLGLVQWSFGDTKTLGTLRASSNLPNEYLGWIGETWEERVTRLGESIRLKMRREQQWTTKEPI